MGSDVLRPVIRAYEFGDLDDETFVAVVTAALSVTAGGVHQSLLSFLGSPGKPVCKACMQRLPIETATSDQTTGNCAICAQLVKTGNLCVALPCSHTFHSACIVRWFSLNHTCPVCRFSLATDDAQFYESIGETGLAYAAELDQLDARRDALNDALVALKKVSVLAEGDVAAASPKERPTCPAVPELPYFAAVPLSRKPQTSARRSRKFPPSASIPRVHVRLPPVRGVRVTVDVLAVHGTHIAY